MIAIIRVLSEPIVRSLVPIEYPLKQMLNSTIVPLVPLALTPVPVSHFLSADLTEWNSQHLRHQSKDCLRRDYYYYYMRDVELVTYWPDTIIIVMVAIVLGD